MEELRAACATVADRARFVQINRDHVEAYAADLPLEDPWPIDPEEEQPELSSATREAAIAYWVTLDAINFGSGWFPTLKKPAGRSGYNTIAGGLRRQFDAHGHWHADALAELDSYAVAEVLDQDRNHPLMRLFAHSLRDLGQQLQAHHDGRFSDLVVSARGSAVEFAEHLGDWDCFGDVSRYDELALGFLKRAQIAAADLARAGLVQFDDLDQLTMFPDNLVPHVLRLDGILSFAPELVARIDREELIEHNSREEVEIRACGLHAVELIVAARPGVCAAQVDQVLWERGQEQTYKSSPRHRSRCTAY
jgi:hypothetical protein